MERSFQMSANRQTDDAECPPKQSTRQHHSILKQQQKKLNWHGFPHPGRLEVPLFIKRPIKHVPSCHRAKINDMRWLICNLCKYTQPPLMT